MSYFPKLNNIVSKDNLRNNITYAIVIDNYIVGTDAFKLVKISLDEFVGSEDEKENLNGKALHFKSIKILSQKKWKSLYFDKKGVKLYKDLYKDNGMEEPDLFIEYDAKLINKEKREFKTKGGEKFIYPDYEMIFRNSIELADKNDYCNNRVINAEYLYHIQQAMELYALEISYDGKMAFVTRPKFWSDKIDAIGLIMETKI